MATSMGFTLQPLPYAYGALAPQISEETMTYHHGKHLAAYVNNLNNLIKGTRFEGMTLQQIVMESDGAIFNNAAQAWNHDFFFQTLSPTAKVKPTGALAAAIDKYFESFDKFKEAFGKAAAGQFGSGWAWLVMDKEGKLSIVARPNAANPLTEGYTPLMTLDVWEHAYYIDYRNRRPDYIAAVWDRVDWAVVEARFAK